MSNEQRRPAPTQHKYPSSLKRKREAEGRQQQQQQQLQQQYQRQQQQFHSGGINESSLVAGHYNQRPDRGVKEREQSTIIGLRKFNNWLKTVLINLHVQSGDNVLDLCCGKGGDLTKYSFRRINHLVGADIAKVSLEQAVERYNASLDKSKFSFKVICADCTENLITPALDDTEWFDVVSCQFALHYSFRDEQHARALLRNATDRLKPGGAFIITIPDANQLVKRLRESSTLSFGNSIYGVTFTSKQFPAESKGFGHRYEFFLEDAIDSCPEYLVPTHVLKALAKEFGLTTEIEQNFHQFYETRIKDPEFDELFNKMVFSRGGSISPEEWEAIGLYKAMVFRKAGDKDAQSYAPHRGQPMPLRNEDIIVL